MKIDKKWCEDVFERVTCVGPLPRDYVRVCLAFQWVRDNVDDYKAFIKHHVIDRHRDYIRWTFMDKWYVPYNMICHIWDKPRGFNGDGNLLQKMYDSFELPDAETELVTLNPYMKTRWDEFLCAKPEFLALQHRKKMFEEQITYFIARGATSFVDLGCGTGQYTQWAFNLLAHTGKDIGPVIGIDNDMPHTYGKSMDGPLWVKQNVLKTLPPYQCDIVYSGGLFDYFSDQIFSTMLERIKIFNPKFIMIGNIDQSRSTKAMMDCLDWELFDRDRWSLLDLAIPRFIEGWDLRVETDPTGHQHFLVMVKNESMPN